MSVMVWLRVPSDRGMTARLGTKGAALCGLFWVIGMVPPLSAQQSELGRLFFSDQVAPGTVNNLSIDQLQYVGFVEHSGENVIGLVRETDTNGDIVTHIVSEGDLLNGVVIREINVNAVIFGVIGGDVSLLMEKDSASQPTHPAKKSQATAQLSKPAGPPKRRSAMAFHPAATADRLKSLASVAGVPLSVLDKVDVSPVPARSQSGRPGWSLDPMLGTLSWLGLPFEAGDVILSLDGISVHDLEALERHLSMKPETEPYRVEIQRDRRAVMLEFRR